MHMQDFLDFRELYAKFSRLISVDVCRQKISENVCVCARVCTADMQVRTSQQLLELGEV